ncbi:alpha/beta hydrolase [Herbiconiux moechotypicola]|uniref:Alpha/beta hydrolase n=1 Tax=Herbiconiux moechotypicola TaxID=637393 RepID=A0ABP5Q4M9_9MICO|nr:alpha/beta hydrolase [Herbiconiux moechotypicola]MCS5728953.1 alpha/beta hydrolase [Herbiconiux moechotypicola]
MPAPLPRVPVWAWRLLMSSVSRREQVRFNLDPVTDVDYHLDLDFVGDGLRGHRLDVIVPHERPAHPLPVYVYFHGGGWTSGDKAPLTKYCATQARAGMVVVNVNYRRATRFTMGHMLHDANDALAWVRAHIAEFGGDADRLVLGGDSAGGQLSALLSAAVHHPELAAHYELTPAVTPDALRGLVQHCSVVDFSVLFEKGFIMSLDFARMLLPSSHAGREPRRAGRAALRRAVAYLSPIEWVDRGYPPVLVTTSERDYFYRANLNFIARLRAHGVHVDALLYDRASRNTQHTWQQDYRHPESQEVYRRLQLFVREVCGEAATTAEPATVD